MQRSPGGSGIDKLRGQTGLPVPQFRDQDGAAAVETCSAQHGIQPRDAAGNMLLAYTMLQTQRGHRQNAESVLVDQEWVFVVPCAVPRYFTMRSRLVETWSVTRWSRRMTQSETYSSSP